ncbi:MAG: bis(5'-nucleosyl)-tetraphosphatase (symmetrical) YqeK [Oscillospiraceae bacterium]
MDTQRNDEFLEEIKKRLTKARFYHSLNVADEAKKLAEFYGADKEKAFTAGLVHDIMKDTDKNEQLRILEKNGISLTNTEKDNPKLWHAISGAVFLEKELNVTDKEIISAVRFHTTGKENMTLLEKIIYIADYIAADRNYQGIEIMREKAYKSLELAMLEGLSFTITYNIKKAVSIHEDSIKCYNEIVREGKK